MPDWRIRVAGDAAVTVELEPRIDPVINARVVALAAAVRATRCAGVRDVVPSYSAVTVYFDPLHTDLDRLWAALEEVVVAGVQVTPDRRVRSWCGCATAARPAPTSTRWPHSPAARAMKSFVGTRRRGIACIWWGFLPGFPYLGIVDARIAMPRRSSPRLAVPAGSVGIAGVQTGIYPTTAPGGWRLIGLAAVDPFDIEKEPPSLFRPGDTVRFEAASTDTDR